MLRVILCLTVAISLCSNTLAQKLAAVPAEINPELPNVLLIGDSISMGYTKPVREKMKGIANVFRPATNCGPTTKGVAELDKWLEDRKWSVIHFQPWSARLEIHGPQ